MHKGKIKNIYYTQRKINNIKSLLYNTWSVNTSGLIVTLETKVLGIYFWFKLYLNI